ncbi:MAG: TniB family NTP-binding protein [Steroidobacteraceae bacterium]|jgi:hypothetical protein|nr:TniB family NTP-binding protein [Steroidobacteraceae bacterium]
MDWTSECITRVNTTWIPHKNCQLAQSQFLTALLTSGRGEIVCVVGPSRVGKSTIVARGETLFEQGQTPDATGTQPCVTVTITNSGYGGFFETKSFAVAALAKLHHPEYHDGDDEGLRLADSVSETRLKRALSKAMERRQTRFMIIDEIHNVFHMRGGRDAAVAFTNSLKDLAWDAKCVLVFVGAYPFLLILAQCPHLIGRLTQIHFPRYRATSREDVLCFEQILASYSEMVSLGGRESLRDWNEMLYEGSLGCIGHLRKWITRALATAQVDKAKYLKKEHFERTRRTAYEFDALRTEIELGEALLEGRATIDDVQRLAPPVRGGRSHGRKPRRNSVRYAVGQPVRP